VYFRAKKSESYRSSLDKNCSEPGAVVRTVAVRTTVVVRTVRTAVFIKPEQ
jgi:hypothetical protein